MREKVWSIASGDFHQIGSLITMMVASLKESSIPHPIQFSRQRCTADTTLPLWGKQKGNTHQQAQGKKLNLLPSSLAVLIYVLEHSADPELYA